ncbi:MAG: inactive transglutaminase family protein [Candidatus Pelagadaptatus aseana]|uniref:UUP1 family membrane protein n=1 Tax=Candidatus Pelagadaptatus aseana TaxID=3120508 RepID=UPI0039B26A6B
MNSRKQITYLVLLLVGLGVSAVVYKHKVLGFPLLANQTETVWDLEAKLQFEADGGPVSVKVNLPDPNPARKISFSKNVSPGFDYKEIEEDGARYGFWSSEDAEGPQTLYLRVQTYFVDEPQITGDVPTLEQPDFVGVQAEAANRYVENLQQQTLDLDGQVKQVLADINSRANDNMAVLLQDRGERSEQMALAVSLLAMQDIPARMGRGIFLADKKRKQSAVFFLEVFDDKQWLLFDPREEEQISWQQVIIMQHSTEPLIEVYGGSDSEFSFSSLKQQRPTFKAAVDSAAQDSSLFVDFSIYSLPLAEQNDFKLLLLIPLGALVVVVLRNLVGIRTSGTFMPILIAMVFLQTSLLAGLALFVIVVGVGLIMRSYMSNLNLLLVPRIASVLVFVIIIYAAIGVTSHKLGIEWGMQVTFFPMIILSWTIERMSILWDEEGGKEVMIQCGGSLLTAVLAYLVMSNEVIADTVFLYPEMLLILLAVIIAIGSYSGYRLSDLRRFEPMQKL